MERLTRLTEERTATGVVLRMVRSSDGEILGERYVLAGRACFRKRLAAARRELRRLANQETA